MLQTDLVKSILRVQDRSQDAMIHNDDLTKENDAIFR